MKKKILVPIISLAMCFAIGYNYACIKESSSVSTSLRQLAEIETAKAEDTEVDDCADTEYDSGNSWECEDGTIGYSYEYFVDCYGNSGSCIEYYSIEQHHCGELYWVEDESNDVDC